MLYVGIQCIFTIQSYIAKFSARQLHIIDRLLFWALLESSKLFVTIQGRRERNKGQGKDEPKVDGGQGSSEYSDATDDQ